MKFKILSIDGGGSRGIYPAAVVNELEKKYGPLADYFDLITGASTGGIIALSLAAGKKADDIMGLYLKDIPGIFKKHFTQFLGQIAFGCKYSNKELKKSLKEFLGDIRLSQSKTRLCIPVVDLEGCRPVIVRTDHVPGEQFTDYLMRDVALATSAAPTFFPAVPLEGLGKKMVDGGFWENNPGFVGLFEAAQHFVSANAEYTGIEILSLGNVPAAPLGLKKQPANASVLEWRDKLISVPMALQVADANRMLRIAETHDLFPIERYVRMEADRLSRTQREALEMDCSDVALLESLAAIAVEDFKAHEASLEAFFMEKAVISGALESSIR